MGRRYLSTLLMLFFQRVLIADDLMAERLASNAGYHRSIADLQERLEGLEKRVDALHAEAGLTDAERIAPPEARRCARPAASRIRNHG
jgi:hypothetical protein